MATSRDTCGACDVACVSGWCRQGNCAEAQVLATNERNPYTVLVDTDNVYWSTGGSSVDAVDGGIRVRPHAGGVTRWLLADQPSVGVMVQDSDYLYFGENIRAGRVRKIRKSGGGLTDLGSFPQNIGGIAVDDSYVYWLDTGNVSTPGAILRAPKTGGTTETLAGGLGLPRALSVQSSEVFFVETGSFIDGSYQRDGSISALSLGDGSIKILATQQDWPSDLLVSQDYVYWVNVNRDAPAGQLVRVEREGGLPAVLYETSDGRPGSTIAIDEQTLYFKHSRGIYAISTDGTALKQLAFLESENAGGLSLDPDFVYWTSHEGVVETGSVNRLRRK